MTRAREILKDLLPPPMGDGPLKSQEWRVDPEKLATYLAELEEKIRLSRFEIL